MLDFNTEPYYDDFSESDKFYRILFRPTVAVQARELTQSQSILQDQVTKFADNIFKQNSPVTGGQITTNFGVTYIKLQDTYLNNPIDVTQFDGQLIQDDTGTILARVLKVSVTANGDPNTLVVSYLSGNQFTNNSLIHVVGSTVTAQEYSSGAVGNSLKISVVDSVDAYSSIFYMDSTMTNVVQNPVAGSFDISIGNSNFPTISFIRNSC